MGDMIVKVYDTKATPGNQELLTEYLAVVPINGMEHQGRRLVTYSPGGDPSKSTNVGIINPDGSTEPQPGYEIRVEHAEHNE